MDQDSIRKYVADTLPGVDVFIGSKEHGDPEIAWGDTFFIYDPERNLTGKYRFPFATIVIKDYGDFDNASNLNRDGVYRLNIGLSKETYRSLFGPQPARLPNEGGAVNTGHDFSALDTLMPHPVYAPQSWVCVLNPSDKTFETIKPLLKEAYDIAVARFDKREARENEDATATAEQTQ
jgi:hypothetical protein